MPIHNSDVAKVFSQVADLLEIQGANQFRVRAYRNAARTVEGLSRSVADMLREGEDLSKISGIGKDLAGKIADIVETGGLELLQELQQQLPGDLPRLMELEGVGPKKIKVLHEKLGIKSVADLKKAAQEQRLRELAGFGAKTEEKLLRAIERYEARKGERQRFRLPQAQQIAEDLLEYLKHTEGVKRIVVAGSYRRQQETVGDLDILASCKKGADIMERFVGYEDVERVVAQGSTRSTVVLRSGIQVDLRVLPDVSYGAAVHYFTGSKAHNIAIRKLGVQRKLKINEYGIFKGDERISGHDEEDVYKAVDLPWIPPELREDRGEIDAARKGKLPQLVTLEDIQGDLHAHTNRTDGRQSLEEMAQGARQRGYRYIAITDHSQRVTVAGGLKPEQVHEQIDEIDALNEKLKGFQVFKGIEVDILKDGTLDLPDDTLARLEMVIASVHSYFDLTREQQTRRIVKAISNPHVRILGHPTGRMIGSRDPYDVDMEEIVKAARKHGCCLEINAHPERLDLNDTYCRLAKDHGVTLAINTDAHRVRDYDFIRFGVGQARRGWLEKTDVLNTRNLTDMREFVRRR